jgi:hypothetical protein
MTIFYCLRFETPLTWRARSPYLYPPRTGWPGYTPRHWVRFSSLTTTRKAAVEVSSSLHTVGGGEATVSQSELLYTWRFTANQFILAPSSLRFTTRIFFFARRVRIIRVWPLHGTHENISFCSCFVVVWRSRYGGPHKKQHSQHFFCYCVRKCGCGHLTFTEPLPSNGRVCRAVPLQRESSVIKSFRLSVNCCL